jgi:hypothetical protein
MKLSLSETFDGIMIEFNSVSEKAVSSIQMTPNAISIDFNPVKDNSDSLVRSSREPLLKTRPRGAPDAPVPNRGFPTVLKEPLGAYQRKCLFIYLAAPSSPPWLKPGHLIRGRAT